MDAVRLYFDDMISIVFNMVVKSEGWGTGIDKNRDVCLLVSTGSTSTSSSTSCGRTFVKYE